MAHTGAAYRVNPRAITELVERDSASIAIPSLRVYVCVCV